MYIKVLLVFIILILSAFFFLHYQNPGAVTFVITQNHSYTLPATLFVFMGFLAGVILAVLNSLVVDVKKAVRNVRTRRKMRHAAETDSDYHKGVEALGRGHIAEARTLLEKTLKARPTDVSLVVSLAETYMKEKRPADAIKVLEDGMTNNPGSVGLLVAIGDAALAAGDKEKAASAYGGAIDKDPKNLGAFKELRDIRVGDGSWDEAANLQKSIIALEPDDKEAEQKLLAGYRFEGAMREAELGNLAEALTRLDAIIKDSGAFLPAEIKRGDVLMMEGSESAAVRAWEQTLRSNPLSAPLLLRLEDAYLKGADPEKILGRYRTELGSRPNDANLRTLLSRLYLRLEMVDNAIEELERLHNDGIESGYTKTLLGEAYLRRRQEEQASALFKEALCVDNDFTPPFACMECGDTSKEWLPRCVSCGQWGTLRMKAPGA
jgi:tetratricopeptide (TPR) repeat protein